MQSRKPVIMVTSAANSGLVSFRIKPSIIPQIPMIETFTISMPFKPLSVLSTAITVDLKSQHKQLLNTFKQFINIWNNPEQHHQKPRQAYQKCLFIPSTVFQDLAENRNQNPYCSDFKNKTYLHSLSFPASAAKYSKTVIYTVKKQIINTCSPKKHSHKYSAQYSHTAV